MTVSVIVAMIVLGMLLVHLLNSRHSDGVSAFHYGRSGMPAPGPAPPAARKGRGRAGTSVAGVRRRLRSRRRTRKAAE
ncbi:hypothetical protein [Streptomyces sp. RG80]|uniref:hypothetical protein n=1 Tax=Streptomyces sp. RG80 TaxID=3157340 RepID=UPI00338DF9D2